MAKVLEKHIHKFKRLTYKSGNSIFFCALPDCSQKLNIALALGKRCICWRCGESFIMNEYALRLAKPHCDNCHHPKKEVWTPKLEEIGLDLANNSDKSLSLADRLQQTIQLAKTNNQEEEDEI